MPEGKHRRRTPQEPEAPWSTADPAEPEPDWAEGIRQGRKARGERLKELFAAFDEDPEEGGQAPPHDR